MESRHIGTSRDMGYMGALCLFLDTKKEIGMKKERPTAKEIAGAFTLLDSIKRPAPTAPAEGMEIADYAENFCRTALDDISDITRVPKSYKYLEAGLQFECVAWFRQTYPALELLLFHIPNEGRRNVRQGARWRLLGGVSGVADLCLLSPKGAIFLELKAPKGRVSDAQKEWRRAVTIAGYSYHVVRALDDFKEIVIESLRGQNF